MIYNYDASGLIFSGTTSGVPYAVHASGTYTWDTVSNTGIWNISVPYDPNNHGFDLGGWFNGFNGSVQMNISFSSTSFDTSYPTNNGTINGDISIKFASPLGQASDAATGTFQVQNDFAPYDYSGTISGALAPASPVPEPSVFILLLVGMLTTTALRAMKRRL
ncbi:MAG: PEP-CTERM sorting domain-containing protein [Hydrogenophilales bacterium]|nr:PEP-CTERM sorting domain-containing protein [Hydrogenophilales bacterium]